MAAKVIALALMGLVACSEACIQLYGTAEEGNGKSFTYSYNGLDWPAQFETCRGSKQSPILVPASGAAGKALPAVDAKSHFNYGQVKNPTIVNTGHTLQVALPADFQSDVNIPIRGDKNSAVPTSIISGGSDSVTDRVKAIPAQFHFHTHSEHVVAGAEYAMEMHIVHFVKSDQLPACADPGCPVVLGVMLAQTDDESKVSPELRKIIDAMPLYQGKTNTIEGTVDLGALLPQNRTYVTYEGSLTTPPCSEGLLWHVMLEPIRITPSLLTRYQEAVGDRNCDTTPEEAKKLEAAAEYFKVPPANDEGCRKIANGHNWRITQPLNGRPLQLATV
ncbi:alpha carbonic anhydrase [Scenedesmus sp. NREL 46B-D3]|nr:alpha carbonic anhydrase [Scenedesmus sp. NREL 46B-D3]